MPPRKTTKITDTTSKTSFKATPAVPPAPSVVQRSEIKGSGTTAKISTPPLARSFTHDQIAKRAYEIYAGRGYAPGDAHADWVEAERQLRAGL